MSDEQPIDDIQQVPSTSPDFKTELAKKLQEVVPEAITDGKVDTKKLQELLDSDSADDSERFGLFWPGKKRAIRAAQEPTTATLRPAKEESKDWDTTENLFIEGDNLEVLKILQKHYHNKIKMIYIDPPYNTGKDFVYPDNYKEGLASYLEFTKQVDQEGRKVSSNSDTDGRYHSNWLNMMYPRLKLARNLLTDDGVIFISIDDHELNHLRKICDEVYGNDNFVACLIWDTNHSAQAGIFKVYHQYILVYSRNITLLKVPSISDGDDFEAGAQKRESARHPVSEFIFPEGTRWDASDGTVLAGEWGDAEKTSLISGNMVCKDGKLSEQVTLRAAWTQKSQMHEFFWGDSTNLVDSRGQKVIEFYFSPTGKIKIVKSRGVLTPPTVRRTYGSQNSISNALADLFKINQSPFDSPKPPEMIREFCSWFTQGSDIILDFFSGSGTSAHGVFIANAEDNGNRVNIQVQLPEPTDPVSPAYKLGYKTIPDIAKKRIELAGKKIENDFVENLKDRESPLDVGYKVFKLADTNFAKWRTSSDTDKDSVQQHLLDIRESSNGAATEEELLTEILLKQGISLTAKLAHKEISGLSVWNIGDNVILAYLNEKVKPSIDQLRAIAETEPAKIVILEDAFQGDDELKTNLSQICKSNKIELWTI